MLSSIANGGPQPAGITTQMFHANYSWDFTVDSRDLIDRTKNFKHVLHNLKPATETN